ncbi:Trypsin [Rubrobacter radiotolerans]|uniref:Serine protease n=1 Tax=Rubrobacter radiotolerans TaxID=42256 RepID=A0A023X3Z0_RUBRA|nr:serine protease [Rubrobacter radiotolerans]AHY46720.1 Trypsin [Rubrobacter radiotolerans]MDX5894127.1 serine protease [Rubrobacter radiotolerans]SMC05270.1 Trypsin [Rubrobacter radiotolerans DSM 5868]
MQSDKEFSVRAGVILTAVLFVAALIFSGSASANDEGIREESVVGGRAVANGEFPFMVAIIDKSRPGGDYDRRFCGGTLIDADSVLTAAHCVRGRAPSSMSIRAGRTVLSSSQGVARGVRAVKAHPRYKRTSSEAYDVAVLTLSSGIAKSRVPYINLLPATINGPETPGRMLTVAGWGNTRAQSTFGTGGSEFPDRMRKAAVPVVSDARAYETYRLIGDPSLAYRPKLMLAAGGNGRDTYQGDSGGPIFTRISGEFYQVGITSYGLGCATKKYPGVYTEVNSSGILTFITEAASLDP